MSKELTEEEIEAQRIKDSVRSTRGHLTRVAKALYRQANFINSNPSVELCKQMRRDFDKILQYRDTVESGFIEVGLSLIHI